MLRCMTYMTYYMMTYWECKLWLYEKRKKECKILHDKLGVCSMSIEEYGEIDQKDWTGKISNFKTQFVYSIERHKEMHIKSCKLFTQLSLHNDSILLLQGKETKDASQEFKALYSAIFIQQQRKKTWLFKNVGRSQVKSSIRLSITIFWSRFGWNWL